jgi:hypothetical protein
MCCLFSFLSVFARLLAAQLLLPIPETGREGEGVVESRGEVEERPNSPPKGARRAPGFAAVVHRVFEDRLPSLRAVVIVE